MASYGTTRAWAVGLLVVGLFGCGEQEPAPSQAVGDKTTEANAPGKSDKPTTADPRFVQSFAEATRADAPADWPRPPDQTLTGKSVGKLYTEITRAWDSVPLVNDSGKRIAYTAVLDTELGPIEIALRSDLAPNHVRNFLALTKAGFYDGLVFQRTVRQKADGHPDLELIEGGCPLGTGDAGHGSIGYWLKPEFNDAPHEEGTVGACHGEEADTACCKFYVLLSKAPYLDKNYTVFGKVTRGLDVARKIFALPVRNDPDYPEGDRPEKPMVIRRVTVEAKTADSNALASGNP